MTTMIHYRDFIPSGRENYVIYQIANDAHSIAYQAAGDAERPGLLVAAAPIDSTCAANSQDVFKEFLDSAHIFAGNNDEHEYYDMITALFHEKTFDDWKVTAIRVICTVEYAIEFYLKSPSRMAQRKQIMTRWKSGARTADEQLPTAEIWLDWSFSKRQDVFDKLFFTVAAPKPSGEYPKHKLTVFRADFALPSILEVKRKHWRQYRFRNPLPRVNEDQDPITCSAKITETYY